MRVALMRSGAGWAVGLFVKLGVDFRTNLWYDIGVSQSIIPPKPSETPDQGHRSPRWVV